MRVDPPPIADAAASVFAPVASASSTAAVVADAGCKSAKDDANAKYAEFCKQDDSRCPEHPDVGAGYSEPDLDGDGVREIAWGWGSGGVNTETYLYRGGSGCAVLLLAPSGNGSVKALPTRHEGWADVSIEDTSHCEGACKCTPDVSFYVFHAGAYHEDEKRHVKGTWSTCAPPVN